MFIKSEYLFFTEITGKLLELESLNRLIDINKLTSFPSIKNELVEEFISTNNIEGDIISFTEAKKFLRKEENLNKKQLTKRWIGIKYAHELIWSDKYQFNNEYINAIHRSLMSKVDIIGGIYKTKLNQVGSLITTLPEETPALMMNLYINFITSYNNEHSIFQIIPFISEFLAIHPYEDGNGRMSRLLMNRLLFDAGYKFVKYISISKFIWEMRDKYIKALEFRNHSWANKTMSPQDLIPLFNVMLDSLILGAKKAIKYITLEKFTKKEFKIQLLSIISQEKSFSQIMETLNIGNSDSSIKKWLKELVSNNTITTSGVGKGLKYKIA